MGSGHRHRHYSSRPASRSKIRRYGQSVSPHNAVDDTAEDSAILFVVQSSFQVSPDNFAVEDSRQDFAIK